MINKYAAVLAGAALVTTASCRTNKAVTLPLVNEERPVVVAQPVDAMPHVIIYKTTRDYSQNVPVIMDAACERIVSYPDPADLRGNCRPQPLEGGFLLDNRGIGETVAFLSYTYDEYAAMPSAPSMDDLLKHIVDRHPLERIVDCGNRSAFKGNLVDAVNEYIKANGLK